MATTWEERVSLRWNDVSRLLVNYRLPLVRPSFVLSLNISREELLLLMNTVRFTTQQTPTDFQKFVATPIDTLNLISSLFQIDNASSISIVIESYKCDFIRLIAKSTVGWLRRYNCKSFFLLPLTMKINWNRIELNEQKDMQRTFCSRDDSITHCIQ
jgi:hypothetical protein